MDGEATSWIVPLLFRLAKFAPSFELSSGLLHKALSFEYSVLSLLVSYSVLTPSPFQTANP